MNSAQDFIYEAVDVVNNDSSFGIKIEKDPNFLLLDPASTIDSLTLVNLFVCIESLIEERLGKTVSLVNEDSFFNKSSREAHCSTSLSHHRTSDVAYGGFRFVFNKSRVHEE